MQEVLEEMSKVIGYIIYAAIAISMVFAYSRSVEIMTTPRTAWLHVV